AAGYLKKQKVLTGTGPHGHTRKPLYLGSSILAAGAAWAMHSWVSPVVLGIYFCGVYFVVMGRGEREMRSHFGKAFEEYAKRVPLFVPRLTPASIEGSSGGAFSFAQYRKNHEYEAALGFFLLLVFLLGIWWLRLGTH